MSEPQSIPLDKFDMSIDISIVYREHIIEYNVVVRNDSPYRLEPIMIYPAIPSRVFMPDRESAVIGPLAGGESSSVTFLLTPNEDFYNLVLAQDVIEGRDVEITGTIRSRQGMITCDILLKNRKKIPIKGLEVSPLTPPGYASPIKSKLIDLNPLESKKVSFNLFPERKLLEYEKKTARYVPFTPRYRRLAPPKPDDMPYGVEPELDPPHPYTRAVTYNPMVPCTSKSIRRLIMLPEIRGTLKIEETTPEEIEIKHIPKIKSELSEKASEKVSKEYAAPSSYPSKEKPETPDEVGTTSIDEHLPEQVDETSQPEDASPRETPSYPCHYCGKKLTFIQEYKRWYCYNCKRYM